MKKRILLAVFVLLAMVLFLTGALGEGIDLGKSGWVEKDGGKYYGDSKGKAVTGQWILDENYYFFDDTGRLQTGWVKTESERWQYFSGTSIGQRWSSRIKAGWRYANDQGKILMDLTGLKSLKIPAKVDALPDRFFAGITRDFVVECEAGSYAEKLAKKLGLPYDNGKSRVVGTGISDVNQKADWIISNYISPGMSDREKAQVLHNWLIYNAHYDYTFSNYTAGGVLIKGTGVCDSYSKAYSLLLTKVGIENKRVTGTGNGGGHAWNVARIDGQWYFVDTTWDDPNDSGDASVSGFENNNYFLVNDEAIRADHTLDEEIWVDQGFVGWIEMGDERYYYGSDGNRATGLQEIIGQDYIYDAETDSFETIDVPNLYYFNGDGVMQTGFQTIENRTYYFQKAGPMLKACWIQPDLNPDVSYQDNLYFSAENGPIYYLDQTGAVTVGWAEMVTTDYQYNPVSQQYEEVSVPCRFYFSADGAMLTGKQQIEGKYYYFSERGMMMTGFCYSSSEDCTYYLGTDGVMAFGWVTLEDNTYYFDETGKRAEGRQTILDKKYYFDYSGALMKKIWLFRNDVTLEEYYLGTSDYIATAAEASYLGEDGAIATGWFTLTEETDVFSQETLDWVKEPVLRRYYSNEEGILQTGWQTIENKVYYLGTDGVMKTGFCEVPEKGGIHYFDENGILQTGWLALKTKDTVYNPETGEFEPTEVEKHYYLDPAQDGKMLTGWANIKEDWYYFEPDGGLCTGWKTIDNSQYYLGTDGKRASGLVTLQQEDTQYNPETGKTEKIKKEHVFLFDEAGKLQAEIRYDWAFELPDSTKRIESEAFAGLTKSILVKIPDTVEYIADDAFAQSSVIIRVSKGSWIAEWARKHGLIVLEQ